MYVMECNVSNECNECNECNQCINVINVINVCNECNRLCNGSTYIKLPHELKHPMKGLINIQNSDNKCFMWCHVRHLNLDGKKLHRITKKI